jgi:AraC-like DNA-binding protein
MDKAEKMQYVKMLYEDYNRFFRMEIKGVYFHQIESLTLRPASLLIYCIICLGILYKKYPLSPKVFSEIGSRIKRYQIVYIYKLVGINIILGLNMIYACYQINFLPVSLNDSAFYFTRGFLFVNLFGQISSLFLFPSILYGLSPKEKSSPKLKSISTLSENEISDELKFLGNRVLTFFNDEKPYLDINFNKFDLSVQLKISQKDLNDVFEFIIKEKFSSLKNRLRVEHAKNMLKNEAAKNLTMEAIGFKSGFASRSSFYAVFKAETGYTPVEYLEYMKDESAP